MPLRQPQRSWIVFDNSDFVHLTENGSNFFEKFCTSRVKAGVQPIWGTYGGRQARAIWPTRFENKKWWVLVIMPYVWKFLTFKNFLKYETVVTDDDDVVVKMLAAPIHPADINIIQGIYNQDFIIWTIGELRNMNLGRITRRSSLLGNVILCENDSYY